MIRFQTLSVPVILASALGCLAVLSLPARADRIHFTDGESITGSLKGIEEGRVNWHSAMLGDLQVPQHHVAWIETDARHDLKTTHRRLENCWMYIKDERQMLHCDQGVMVLGDWKLVVNAGATQVGPPELKRRSNLVLAAEDSSGNSDITRYNVDTRTELRYIDTRHTIALRYQEESADGDTTRNMWRTSYQYDQFFTDQWFTAGNVFYEEDEFRELDRRASAGLGMGYQFLETSYFDLLGKGSLNYVDEEFSNGDSRSTPAFLWNLNFAWKFNEQGMELFHRHAVLQAFESAADYEITTLTGFRYPVNGHLSSVLQLEYDYDNLPADEAVEKKDQKWSIGINYDW